MSHAQPSPLQELKGVAHRVIERLRLSASQVTDDLRAAGLSGLEDTWPRINIAQTETALELSVELPGMSRDHVELTLEDDILTIYGAAPDPDLSGRNYVVLERSAGVFARAIRLPGSVDATGAVATMADGLLRLTLPLAASGPSRVIPIGTRHDPDGGERTLTAR